ncbi:hypothetical protein CR513_50459, partial [Mucuna pruriens]
MVGNVVGLVVIINICLLIIYFIMIDFSRLLLGLKLYKQKPFDFDNANARKDLKEICKHLKSKLIFENEKYKKSKTTYTVCEWVKQLNFPYGFTSNILRCTNIDEGKLYRMKSYDYHDFMQKLISLAFLDMFPKPILGVLTKLSLFFKEICTTEIRVSIMDNVKHSIIETTCKLEKIFSLAFFDSMEYLVIHLFMKLRLKDMCSTNGCIHLRGSICEAYIIKEIYIFAFMYFDPSIQTGYIQVPQNDDGHEDMIDEKSIFKYQCHPIKNNQNSFLTNEELQNVNTYVLGSSKVVTSFNGLIINEYKFPTKDYEHNKATTNSGVCIKENIYGENDLDYYGIIEEII